MGDTQGRIIVRAIGAEAQGPPHVHDELHLVRFAHSRATRKKWALIQFAHLTSVHFSGFRVAGFASQAVLQLIVNQLSQ